MNVTIIPDFGQIYDEVKLVLLDPNPLPFVKLKSKNTTDTKKKKSPEMHPVHKKSTSTIIDNHKKDK